MSTIKLNGASSGSSIIKAPDSGSTNQTFTLPASTGTLVTTTDAGVAGITSSADATAMTIDSNEHIGIGIAPKIITGGSRYLTVGTQTAGQSGFLELVGNRTANAGQDLAIMKFVNNTTEIAEIGAYDNGSTNGGDLKFRTSSGGTASTKLEITSDGRGISKFTAHAWGKVSCQGTPSLIVGHNVSSIEDRSTGRIRANYTVSSSAANSVTASGQNNNYYDEIYYVDVDDSGTSRASFGCSRQGAGAGWFDTYKMTFVTFT